jgi:hypothetical protein
LDNKSYWFKYSKIIAGAGIQTAALAFGGDTPGHLIQEQQKNMMEQLGQHHLQV